MAKTSSQVQQEFLDAFSANMANPINMDKLGVGYKAFMDAQKIVGDDGVAVYDPTKPYGIIWNDIEDTYFRIGHTIPAVQQMMRRCVCLGNPQFGGTVEYYLDANDSTLKEDGSSAALDIAGAGGRQVFVEIPKFYSHMYKLGSLQYMWMSLTPFEGGTTHDAFKMAGWTDGGLGTDDANEVAATYISAFENCLYDDSAAAVISGTGDSDTTSLIDTGVDKLLSVVGHKPWSGLTRAESRLLIANGASKAFSWHQHEAMTLCFTVEFMTNDSQSAIPGYTENTGGTYANDVLTSGLTTSLGNSSGSISGSANHAAGGGDGGFDGVVANSYRGIENFYGHLWQWVDGVNVSDWKPYVCPIDSAFADTTLIAPYSRALDSNGAGITQPASNGYQSTRQDGSFFVKSIGANSVSKVTDYYYQSSGDRVLYSGGGLSDGSLAGLSCLLFSSTPSASAWSIASR